ncbi:MAG TPA: hypothetical protein VKR43_06320 [Bryobacteraceae bacterium]|nr:hypothetical protein [Bryobacteraceae bacterium]
MRVANRIPARWQTALLAAGLFVLNFYVCRELFGMEYVFDMGSIESAYFGIDRWALAHWRDLQWFPLWYDGIPFQNAYPPMLQAGVVLFAKLTGFSVPHAHHWVIALAYCLGPVAVFALAMRLSGSRFAGFVAGLIYSCVSMSAWLIPMIAKDLGSRFYPRRLQALVIYGESPHLAALTLLPVAVLLLDLALERRRAGYFLLTVTGIEATALTNWLAAFALALAIAAYMLARDFRWRDFAWLGLICAAAYAIAMPWIPPSTIATTRMNASNAGGDFTSVYGALPVRGAIIVAMIAGLKLALRRLPGYLQFGIFFAALTAMLPLGEAWFGIAIVPQPARYHFEMEMGLAMLAGFVGYAYFRTRAGFVILVLLVAMIYPVKKYRNYSRSFLMRPVDITKAVEWRTAQWLNRNWSGERVMMPGSTSVWLAAFSDVPQLGGGYDQGVTNFMTRLALYEIYTDAGAGEHSAENSVLWLKALGVQAVGVSPVFTHPNKFDGVLEPLWRDGDETIYRVGAAHASLARVVSKADIVTRTPVNAADVDGLRAYVAGLENPEMPRAEFRWTSAHSARVEADVREGQVVSVQMSWDRGWRAVVNGREVEVRRDGIGLMVMEPGNGRVAIEMSNDGGAEMRVARWVSILAGVILLGVVWKGFAGVRGSVGCGAS